MGKVFAELDGKLAGWIGGQRMFFVGTAPSGAGGHVNLSPKGGIETFRIAGPREVAYLDVVGSGVETIAHLRDNGRIVVMFCAFEGPPRIVRLHGRGTVTQVGDAGFAELAARPGFAGAGDPEVGARAIITIAVDRIADSCGYGVPLMDYRGPRSQYVAWVQNRLRQNGEDGVLAYSAELNRASLDCLPGIRPELLSSS